jgi:hypothetical protein
MNRAACGHLIVGVIRLQKSGLLLAGLLVACGARKASVSGNEDESGDTQDGDWTGPDSDGNLDVVGDKLDVGGQPPPPADVDILLVVDNSLSMQEEQLNVARNMALLWWEIENLEDSEGNLGVFRDVDLHLMVTTTDVGGPQCPNVEGYAPHAGAPVTTGCNERIDEFSVGEVSVEEACAEVCPTDVTPDANYIRVSADGTTNVPDDDVGAALACLGTQGIAGCEYGQPLEAMLRALDPEASWNQGEDGFLRDSSSVVVFLVTDEPDCSVADPSLFEDGTLMNDHPDSGEPEASQAVCWNAGVSCDDDGDGGYENCESKGTRLHPVDRYLHRLREELIADENRYVMVLAALGVPLVTEHNPDPPFQPIQGGAYDIEYRDWLAEDVLPTGGPTAAHEQWAHGIGPGCTQPGEAPEEPTRQATPPVRAVELCQGVEQDEHVRCCIESICDQYWLDLVRCMTPPFTCFNADGEQERCLIPPN